MLTNVMLDRRGLLGKGLATAGAAMLLPPERLFAATAPTDWTIGVADLEEDVAPHTMRLVSGKLPADLAGSLYRNGPAKFRRPGGSETHWFDGDGMVRRFTLRDGQARCAARFVDTEKRRQEAAAGAMLLPGFGTPGRPGAAMRGPDSANAANTSVLFAGGELWALWEAGSPYRIDPETLATQGPRTLRSDLAQMPFLAHPRVEPDGTVWNLGQSGKQLIVWKLAANGALADAQMVEMPRASYLHDFTATDRHLVIVLQPWVQTHDASPVIQGFEWQPQIGTQVVVIDKADLSRRRVFELPAFSFFHMGDAWAESDGTIRFDICTMADPSFAVAEASDLLLGRNKGHPAPMLSMVVLRADGRGVLLHTPHKAEFPQGDRRHAGTRRRHSVYVGLYDRQRPMARGLGVMDWESGHATEYDFGVDHLVEEFLFVPRGSAEGDGWLVGTTINIRAKATELHVLDARNVQAGPVASLRADRVLPHGFHGTWKA